MEDEKTINTEQIERLEQLFDLDRKIESDEDLIALTENFDEDE